MARWPPMGPPVALGLRYAGRLLPLRRVFWSPHLIGFYHPRPTWSEHMVLVPTTPIRDLLVLGQRRHAPLFAEIMLAAAQVLRERSQPGRPCVVCANGGQRQDVMQVHFHLLRDERWVTPLADAASATGLLVSEEIAVVWHPRPAWQTHVVLVPRPRLPGLLGLGAEHAGALARLGAMVPRVHHELELRQQGYTLVMQTEAERAHQLELHLIAGERRSR